MPSTIGLARAIRESPAVQRFAGHLAANVAGDLTLPADLLARAGMDLADDLIYRVGPDGLRLTSDTLRKVYVEVTSACNLACATCIRRAWDEPVGHMSLPRFVRLLDGISGTEGQRSGEALEQSGSGGETRGFGDIALSPRHPAYTATAGNGAALSLSGFGEPLVHLEFLELVRLARERGLRIELITNGTLLDAQLAAELAGLGVAQVAVSLDGGDAATYVGMRGVDWTPAVAALRALVAARRRARFPMAIGAAFVATRRNATGLPSLLELAHGLSLDFVSISNVVPHTAEMAAEMLSARAAWAGSYSPSECWPRLDLANMDLDPSTRPALAAIWERAPVAPPPGLGEGRPRNHCRFVREGMLAVSWDGQVAPCLSLLHTHPEYVNGHWKTVRRYAVGRIDEYSLPDIWRDPVYRAFRGRVRAFEFSPCCACGGCPETDTNDTDCYGSPFPSCSECLWAQGIVLCP